MSFRFNRDMRFGEFTYADFMQAGSELLLIVRQHVPDATVEIRSHENTGIAAKFPRARLFGTSAMEKFELLTYPVERFDLAAWDRILDAEFRIEGISGEEAFQIRMTCSRRPITNRMYFYGNGVVESLFTPIYEKFAKPSLGVTIGNEIDRLALLDFKEPKRVA